MEAEDEARSDPDGDGSVSPNGGGAAEETAVDEASPPGVGTFLYKMALAGVGAFVLAQEEVEALLRKLVERGDLRPEEKERLLEESARHSERERRTVAEQVDATIQKMLHSINVPTRDDVDSLSQRIEELARRVQALKDKPE